VALKQNETNLPKHTHLCCLVSLLQKNVNGQKDLKPQRHKIHQLHNFDASQRVSDCADEPLTKSLPFQCFGFSISLKCSARKKTYTIPKMFNTRKLGTRQQLQYS